MELGELGFIFILLFFFISWDFFKIPKAENTGVLVGQKKDFTPHFVELISD